MSRLVLPQGSVLMGVLQGMLDVATGEQGTVQALAVTWVTSQEHCTVMESQNIPSGRAPQDHWVQLLILHRAT